jgi:hypothetical protein
MAQGPGEVAAPTADALRSQIEETRAQMSDTIDAIQTRLSPARVLADAKESVADATVGRVKRLARRLNDSSGSALETVRDNPLPIALVTTAIAGLTVWALRHRNNRRLLAAAGAGAGAACWAIWRARSISPSVVDDYPEPARVPDGGL